MNTAKEILKNMVADVISATDKITYFGIDGVARALLNAGSNAMSEIWADHYQTVRNIFVNTAEGSALDDLAATYNLTRKTATKSSVVLLFNGPASTTIPINTIVKSNLTQTQYKTLSEITLGDENPNIERPIQEYSIGDAVLAESISTGSQTKVNTSELTQLATPITDVTVTNNGASIGGADLETDEELRIRIINQISLLNQGTVAFYESLAQAEESTVYKAKAFQDVQNNGVKLYLMKDSFGTYTPTELGDIADGVYAKQRALTPVTCYNTSIKGIEISFTFNRDTSIDLSTIFQNVASEIAIYLRNIMSFGALVEYQKILDIIIGIDGIELLVSTLLVNGQATNVSCSSIQVPRLISLSIFDGITIEARTITQKILRVVEAS